MRMHYYYHEDLSRSKVSRHRRHCNGDKPINFFSHLLQTADNDTVSDLCCCSAAVVWSADNAADRIHTEPLHSAARPSEISADKSPPRGEPPG